SEHKSPPTGIPVLGIFVGGAYVQTFALRSCPKISERIQAIRDRSVSRLERKFWFWEFLFEVLTCRSLLGGAVLK
ncbi:hypothetical protein KTE19_08780, partial [Lentilactobacillus sp. IMAU92037]|uniref:hypothetical protein n=1 Tax=Lentilactobacillus dabitei TaxID=2831523 RepID=UPI001C2C3E21